jgi:hypothetical protein
VATSLGLTVDAEVKLVAPVRAVEVSAMMIEQPSTAANQEHKVVMPMMDPGPTPQVDIEGTLISISQRRSMEVIVITSVGRVSRWKLRDLTLSRVLPYTHTHSHSLRFVAAAAPSSIPATRPPATGQRPPALARPPTTPAVLPPWLGPGCPANLASIPAV